MSKFNRPLAVEDKVMRHPDATVNHEGGHAYKVSPELELYLRAAASMVEDKFYTSANEELQSLRELIRQCDQEYVLKLANYVRNQMHLRSIAVVLLAEASVLDAPATKPGERSLVRQYTPKIIRRADEPMELVSYWINVIGNGSKANFPNALKKGISDAIQNFDEFQLARYNRNGAVKMRDVLFITHAKAGDGGPKYTRAERKQGLKLPLTERQQLLDRIVRNELKTPDTWETRLSTQGASEQSWNEAAKNMGIMALLRNIRNFEKHGAKEAIREAISRFTNPDAVKNSKQLPFRWYNALRYATRQDIRDALHTAVNLSLANVSPWGAGNTVILFDSSASMRGRLSSKGITRHIDVAAMLAAMATALSPDGYRVGGVSTNFRWLDTITKHDSVMTNVQRVLNAQEMGATYAYKAIEAMRLEKVHAERVIFLSDMQCYNDKVGRQSAYSYFGLDLVSGSSGESLASEWMKYRQQVNPNARLYSIDLAGYGTTQFAENDPSVVLLAGWSESVLDLIRHIDQGGHVIDEIKDRW